MLIILDGWGYSESRKYNAIAQGRTPVWDDLWSRRPTALLDCSGESVGLPIGQMGNSEVGHMVLGAGRVICQDLARIDRTIEDGSFANNPAFLAAINAIPNQKLHLMGLLSPGGVHSHENHFIELIRVAATHDCEVIVHAFLDGRDTPPKSAETTLRKIQSTCESLGQRGIASICGRYYAMDRDRRWERTKAAYRLLTECVASRSASNENTALRTAYELGEFDEFVKPTLVGRPTPVQDGDAVVFMNFRADRARQLSTALIGGEGIGFKRKSHPALALFVAMASYGRAIDGGSHHTPVKVAFSPTSISNSLGEHLANLGKSQLRIAETEKYAHVTYFFSGGREEPFDEEGRHFIPSPSVSTYDLAPEMSCSLITDRVVHAIGNDEVDFIVCNFANGDMVGHTGKFNAAVKAVEAIDASLGRITEAINRTNSHCLITSDHGNVEQMLNPADGQPHTAHTTGPVPLVYVGSRSLELRKRGSLADVAPTLLSLMQLSVPDEMTGQSLIQ